MYQLVEVADIFADACVRDDNGNLLFASLYGRDGALLQLLSAFSLNRDAGGLNGFTLVDEAGDRHVVNVPDVGHLDKLSGRLPKANLFGNLAHTWLYDKRLVKRDYVNRVAWVIDEAPDSSVEAVMQHVHEQAWLVMKDLSPIPLLDHWKSKVLEMTADMAIHVLNQSSYPPVGRVTGFRVELKESFVSIISGAVRDEKLTVNVAGACENEETSIKVPSSPIRLSLGQICMTPGSEEAVAGRTGYVSELLRRHASGDWGHICHADRMENLAGIKMGWRIMSAYPIDPSQACEGHGDNTIWIITEADRSVTTLLLPNEY